MIGECGAGDESDPAVTRIIVMPYNSYAAFTLV